MKNNDRYKINSVQRISDGVIFSIGDKIGINGDSPEIFKIEINDPYVWLHYLSIEHKDPYKRKIYNRRGGINYTSELQDAIKR